MDDKRFWDRYSKNYSALMRRSERMYLQIHKAIRPFLKRDMDVLELACGTGQLSVPLSPYVRTWEATDFSPEMVTQAKNSFIHRACISQSRMPQSCPMAPRALMRW